MLNYKYKSIVDNLSAKEFENHVNYMMVLFDPNHQFNSKNGPDKGIDGAKYIDKILVQCYCPENLETFNKHYESKVFLDLIKFAKQCYEGKFNKNKYFINCDSTLKLLENLPFYKNNILDVKELVSNTKKLYKLTDYLKEFVENIQNGKIDPNLECEISFFFIPQFESYFNEQIRVKGITNTELREVLKKTNEAMTNAVNRGIENEDLNDITRTSPKFDDVSEKLNEQNALKSFYDEVELDPFNDFCCLLMLEQFQDKVGELYLNEQIIVRNNFRNIHYNYNRKYKNKLERFESCKKNRLLKEFKENEKVLHIGFCLQLGYDNALTKEEGIIYDWRKDI